MAQSDLDLLLDMGFERARAELAVKKSGGRE
jgi:UBX domain-containing protein 1/4